MNRFIETVLKSAARREGVSINVNVRKRTDEM